MSKSSATHIEAANLAQLFLKRVEKSGDKEAFRIPENGDWTSISWKQAADRVEPLAAGLLSLGVEPVPAARREVRRQRGLPHPGERRLDVDHLETGG